MYKDSHSLLATATPEWHCDSYISGGTGVSTYNPCQHVFAGEARKRQRTSAADEA